MTDFGTLTASLRRAAARSGRLDKAALELLISHETWLRRDDFADACIVRTSAGHVIRWPDARGFADDAAAASSAITILRTACLLAMDDHGLANLGRENRRLIAQALADGLGVTLEARNA